MKVSSEYCKQPRSKTSFKESYDSNKLTEVYFKWKSIIVENKLSFTSDKKKNSYMNWIQSGRVEVTVVKHLDGGTGKKLFKFGF